MDATERTEFFQIHGEQLLRVELAMLRGAYENDDLYHRLCQHCQADDPRFHFKQLFPLILNHAHRRFLRECVAYFEAVTEATRLQISGGMIDLDTLRNKWFTKEYGKATQHRRWAEMPRDVGRCAVWRAWKLFTAGGEEAWKQKRIPLLGFTDAEIDWPRIRITKMSWLEFDFSDIGKKQEGLYEWFKNCSDRPLGIALYPDKQGRWQIIASFERRPGEELTPYRQRVEARATSDREIGERVLRVVKSTGAARLAPDEVIARLGQDGMLISKKRLGDHLGRLGIKTEVVWSDGKAVRVLDRGTLEKLLSKSVDYI